MVLANRKLVVEAIADRISAIAALLSVE